MQSQLHHFLSFIDTKAISSQPNYLLAFESKVLWLPELVSLLEK